METKKGDTKNWDEGSEDEDYDSEDNVEIGATPPANPKPKPAQVS